MDIFAATERLMRMSDVAWARHANPWSVLTRLFAGPLIFFALWSPYWIGWTALLVIGLAVAWLVINPRLFPSPKTTDSWSARGVLGERAFLNRKAVPIPAEFARLGWITTSISIGFLVLFVYGFLYGRFWLGFAAWHGALVAKVWFVDRMAWLWDVMKDRHPVYRTWAAADWSATLEATSTSDRDRGAA